MAMTIASAPATGARRALRAAAAALWLAVVAPLAAGQPAAPPAGSGASPAGPGASPGAQPAGPPAATPAAGQPSAPAGTEGWPARPVRLVVPFPPGGGNDILARTLGQRFQAKLGQPFVVESRPGAGGNIGAEAVAKAAPDGYTLLLATNTLTINPSLMSRMPFDTRTDFAPVALLAATPFVLIVNNAVPARSLRELVDFARAHPGKLSYATPGVGTPHHFGMEHFKALTRTYMVHVPYKGSAPALTDLMAGQVEVMLVTINAALKLVQDGRVRALAVAEPARLSSLREVPTTREAGVPDFEVSAWYALLAPARTPPEVLRRLGDEALTALAEPEVRDRLVTAGFEITPGTAEQLRRTIQSDLERWSRVARSAGIRPE